MSDPNSTQPSTETSIHTDTVAVRGKKPWRRPTVTIIDVQRTVSGGSINGDFPAYRANRQEATLPSLSANAQR